MTSLLGDAKVPKYHLQPEAYGTVDEASAALGLARAVVGQESGLQEVLLTIQRDLYGMMAELAATPAAALQFRTIDDERVAWLEGQIDVYGEQITMPREFVVPGDTLAGAALDLGRTIVRRAERLVIRLYDEGLCSNNEIVRYLNRLSSLCFVLARRADASVGGPVTLAKTEE
jgi:cob(I)alamin adenosyltransferase